MVEVDKQPIDRISLNPKNRMRLDKWIDEINAHLKGMVKVTRTDLVNCLLEEHSNSLSSLELNAAAKYCFDEVRWLNSAMDRLKKAKRVGETLSMEALLEERNALLGEGGKPLKGRPRKSQMAASESFENQSSKGKASI
jgi:hypothetical protein